MTDDVVKVVPALRAICKRIDSTAIIIEEPCHGLLKKVEMKTLLNMLGMPVQTCVNPLNFAGR